MATEIERGGMEIGGPHEPSYYEIALTNRQVVVAFIILLVCLVAAFFSGVWIGRESSTRAWQQLARATAPAGSAGETDGSGATANPATADKPDGQALKEFKFFNDQHKQPGQGAVAGRAEHADRRQTKAQAAPGNGPAPPASGAPANPATTATPLTPATPPTPATTAMPAPERVVMPPAAGTPSARAAASQRQAAHEAAGREPAGSQPAAANAGGASVPAAPTPDIAGEGEPLPAGAGSGARPAKAVDAAAASGPAATTPKPAAPSHPSTPATAEGGAGVVIQVFSSSDKAQAEKIRDRLVKSGQQAYLSPIDKAGQTMYRVRIGPFPSREKAEKVAEQVRREQKLDTWITPR